MAFDWTMFFDEHANDFHESFRKELSRQLLKKGSAGTGIQHFEKYNFQSMVGARELNMRLVDSKVYAEVEFITPTSFSFPVMIYWTSNEKELLQMHTKEVSGASIDINWAPNFPFQKILPYIKPYKIDRKEKTGWQFEVRYYYYLVPDITLQFEFVIVTEQTFSMLDKILKQFCDLWNRNHRNIPIDYVSNAVQTAANTCEVMFDLVDGNGPKIIKELLQHLSNNLSEKNVTFVTIR
ncbi:MAG TPA: hypothetical protein VEY71_11685 [Chitinophagales bacterium]|nr:hypothetical protein [Chitinophagales bacterium]